jgi:Lon protease-like protein
MSPELMPLFPLSVVLLPRHLLPLHIFEDRYKEMIAEAIRSGSEFGVVLAAKEGIARIGCTAIVERVLQQYEDGRMDIVTRGQRRFAIHSLDQEKDYLRAEVEFFDDDDPEASPDLRIEALRVCADLPKESASEESEGPQLSFELAQRVEDLEFRQQLLMSRSEADRLRRIIRFAPTYMEQRRRIDHLKEIAPQNGHGHLPAGKEI